MQKAVFSEIIFTHCHRYLTFYKLAMKRVCVIGAGAAGLVAIRHVKEDPDLDGCVFEKDDGIGGVWNYTGQTGNNQYGIPVHSTAYKGLRTNLPKDIMGFLDYPFSCVKDSGYTYIEHKEVLNYLNEFAKVYELGKLIHFATRVLNVEPTEKNNSQTTWKVTTENLKTKETSEHFFDSVLVCNGHYTKPYIPKIEHLEEFKGEVWHSRDYREPEAFRDKKIIVFGDGPSGIDICLELAQFSPYITLSGKSEKAIRHLPGVYGSSPVVSAKCNSFLTSTGKEIECEVILFCTGYQYDFPFLSPSCGISIQEGKYIYPLHRHLIHAKVPSMAFIGIPFTVCPFPQFDIQVRYFLKCLKGDIPLPPEDVMISEIKKEEDTRSEQCIPLKHSHKFADKQWDYNRKLAEEAGFSNLIKPVIERVYNRSGERRLEAPQKYKTDYVRIIDAENFDYIETRFPQLSCF